MISSLCWRLCPLQEILKHAKHPVHGLYLWVLLPYVLGEIWFCFYTNFTCSESFGKWQSNKVLSHSFPRIMNSAVQLLVSMSPFFFFSFPVTTVFIVSLLSKPFFFFFFPYSVVLQTTKAFLPRMLELQNGHIVCLNSVLALSAIPGAIDYCTSKASSFAFMESLTLGLLDCPGVNATTVLPFHTSTEMFQGMRIRSVQGN